MDIFEKIIRENCWKFDKGYPDSQEDIDYLKTLIEQQLSIFSDEELDALTVKVKKETGVDLDKVSSDVRQDILDLVGDDGTLSDSDLEAVKNYVSGIKYKKEIIDYISSKGAGEAAVATKIFNKMVELGEAKKYSDYIKNSYKYSYLGTGGDFFKKFDLFSKELISFLLDQTPSVRRISTGKGEILLSTMLSDVKDASEGGDIDVEDGKPVEVKNKGAIPMGQKAEFAENTINTVYDEIENDVNKVLTNDITLRMANTRPFNRFGKVFSQIKEEQPKALKNYLTSLSNALKRNYVGLDFDGFEISSYVRNNELDWLALERDMSKKVIELYIELEDFEEILFLNDKTGKYEIVPSGDIADKVGTDITAKFADGMPRWTYNF